MLSVARSDARPQKLAARAAVPFSFRWLACLSVVVAVGMAPAQTPDRASFGEVTAAVETEGDLGTPARTPLAQATPLAQEDAAPRLSIRGQRKFLRYRRQVENAPQAHKLTNADSLSVTYDDGTNRTRVMVLVRDDGATPERERFGTLESRAEWQAEVEAIQTAVIRRIGTGDMAVRTRYKNFAAFACEVTANGLSALMADPDVAAVQADTLHELHLAQGIPLMNASSVRTVHDGSGLTIAVIDDGVDYTHPNLGGGVFPNAKVIGGIDTSGAGDADPYPGGGNSHGTSVSGIACGNIPAAIANDYIGGMAPGARIAAVKVFADGAGFAFNSDIVEGIDWCVANQFLDPANPIMIINMSLGGGRFFSAAAADGADAVGLASVNAAVAAGITVIASSGNDGYCDSMGSPGALSPVISVGAVYDANIGNVGFCVNPATCYPGGLTGFCTSPSLAIFENTSAGQVTCYSNSASFLDVFGASNNAFTPMTGTGYTSGFGGTSAASPYVAGAVALIQAAAKAETGSFLAPATIRTLLTSTGTPTTDTKGGGLSPGITKPLVNVEQAYLTIASGNPLPEITTSETSLSLILPSAGSDDTPFDIGNEADAGGFNLDYTITTSVEGSVTDTIGSSTTSFSGATRYRGNIYQATSNSTLTLIEAYLSFTGTQELDFVVYEMDAFTNAAVKTLIYGEFATLTGSGPGFYSPGPIDVSLQAGKWYVIATGWATPAVTYYRNSASQPAVGFGQKVQAFAADGTYPFFDAFTGGVNGDPSNYYQRITTGLPSWITTNPMSGSVAPQSAETVTVGVDATGFAPGNYRGTVTINSNDSDESPLDLPVGLRVGLTGQIYVDFNYVGIEFGTMVEPYNTLGEGQQAIAPGPSSQISIAGGGTSNETSTGELELFKEMNITATDGEVTVGSE